ncbi:MAG: Trm112 family protein [Desulfuromonas sp.]|nr:Trm112 family protein [Desulfuromonas sp.]
MQQTPKNAYDVSFPLDIVVCPKCKGRLDLLNVDEEPHLLCASCSLAYPIRSGIPLMLQDEAVVL